MTNCKTTTAAQPAANLAAAGRKLALTALMASLAGCGMINSVIEPDRVEYRQAKKAAPLDVPPDLTQLERDGRYAVPDGKGVATASTYRQPRIGVPGAVEAGPASGQVGPVNTETMRVERAGSQRWLVVNMTPEQLWPHLKDFWADSGFTIVSESTAAGTMETGWAENRAKIPQDFIRRTIGKVFDSAYSTGERDKFRTRLERTASGGTEIYISHRGAEEVLTGPQKETTTWTARANDPELEAYFLSRLMARLSGRAEDKAAVAQAEKVVASPVAPQQAKRVGDAVELNDAFDRAWRRVGLALDRVGFTVEDRDRVQGVYFVRYVDPEVQAKEGFWSKLLSLGASSEKLKEAQRYRIAVKQQAGGNVSHVTVLGNDGKPTKSETSENILKLLVDELK
jgi:outer membrane protein assembly factor BamC